jgi:hypothetical protein
MRNELLGCTADPAQHEQRMLTGNVVPSLHPANRLDGDRVIVTTFVELRGLRPERLGDLRPAQFLLSPLTIQRLQKRTGLEISNSYAAVGVTGFAWPGFGCVAHDSTLCLGQSCQHGSE